MKTIYIMVMLAMSYGSASLAGARNEEHSFSHHGFAFTVPHGRTVELAADHVRVNRTLPTRAVDEITIWNGAAPALASQHILRRTRPVAHRIAVMEGGMGGPEYIISIPKKLGQKTITVRAYIQSEEGVPAFVDAWNVWESLTSHE